MSIRQENKQKKSLIKQRIAFYLKLKGTTLYKFYQQSGVTRGVLDPKSGMTEGNLLIFLQYAPEISLDWLIFGKGEMTKSDNPTSSTGTGSDPNILYPSGTILRKAGDIGGEYRIEEKSSQPAQGAPVYELKHYGSLSRFFATPETERSPEAFVAIPDMPRCDGAMYVRGEGMPPMYQNGDIILYKQMENPEELLFGEIYLISIEMNGEEHLAIRRIRQGSRPGTLLLSGSDIRTDTQEIHLSRIRALALIKACIRYNTPE